MSGPFFRRGAARSRSLPIEMTGGSVDETAPPGTPVGLLVAPSADWTLHLADTAGGRFARRRSDSDGRDAAQSKCAAAADDPRGREQRHAGDASLVPIQVRRPLPPLPLATGAKVICLGHSMIDRSGWGIVEAGPPPSVSNLSQSNVRGVLPWVRLLDDRFNLDVFADLTDPYPVVAGYGIDGAYQAISGEHLVAAKGLPGTIARTPYIATMRPGIVYLHIGENDVNSSVSTSAELIQRLDLQLRLLRDEGIWVVIQTLCHRSYAGWPEADPRHAIVVDANAWILA